MIKYGIRGGNLEVTEAIRDYVVSKSSEKIEKYFQADQELDARVTQSFYREKDRKVAPFRLDLSGYTFVQKMSLKICTAQLI